MATESDLTSLSLDKNRSPKSAPTETLMARGSVVSFFRGGLAAVRIDEENLDTENEETDNELSPTDVPDMKPKFSSDAGTEKLVHSSELD